MKLLSRNFFTSSEFLLQFRRGLEEASKFLPMGNYEVDKAERERVQQIGRGEERIMRVKMQI